MVEHVTVMHCMMHCMIVSKWNLADSDGLMAFNIKILLPLSRFAKDDPAVLDCFSRTGGGKLIFPALLLWPRVPERNRDRQDKEIASLGILAKRVSFFVKKEFSFIQTGRWNLKTDIILKPFPLKEAERRKENCKWNKKDLCYSRRILQWQNRIKTFRR
mgnify:CR=1 FL=1